LLTISTGTRAVSPAPLLETCEAGKNLTLRNAKPSPFFSPYSEKTQSGGCNPAKKICVELLPVAKLYVALWPVTLPLGECGGVAGAVGTPEPNGAR